MKIDNMKIEEMRALIGKLPPEEVKEIILDVCSHLPPKEFVKVALKLFS